MNALPPPPLIGYLVPEFPGPTHTFFHRELMALRQLGAEPALVSTRRPPAGRLCHAWAEALAARTTYLAPMGWRRLARALKTLALAGPRRWRACWEAVWTAPDLTLAAKAQTLLLAVFAADLVAWCRLRGVTHVHSHFCAGGAHVAMLARLLGGVPYSVSLHGALWTYGGNQRNKWRHAAFGIAVTKTLLAEGRRELGDAAPLAWGVAPMGVDTEAFRRERPYAPYTGAGALRLVSCGRLNPGKGCADLLRAVALVRAGGLDCRLRIVGADDGADGAYLRHLEQLASELGVRPMVEFLGAGAESVVQAELAQAHVYALASLHEALGVATMEAMAMGVPAVATRVGGVPELIDDGVHGLLVAAAAPAALAAAIRRVAEDPALALRLSAAGRERIVRDYQPRTSAELLLALVKSTSGAG